MPPRAIRTCRFICNRAITRPPPAQTDDAPVDQDGLTDKMLWLVDRVIQDRWFGARVLPQLHVLLWGNKRGV